MKRLIFLSMALAAAATAYSAPVERQQAEKDACASLTWLGGVRALDSRTAVVFSSMGKPAYVVTLGTPLPELKFATRYAYIDGDRDGQLCGRSRDAIAIPNDGLRIPARIMAMTRLDAERIQALEQKYDVTLTKKKPQDEAAGSDQAQS